MKFKLLTFNNTPSATKEALLDIADNHFHSIDPSNNKEVFAISRGIARWLLHNCQHETPEAKDIRKIATLTYEYNKHGAKKSWPKKPVVIDVDNAIIRDWVARLYAIAHASTGVCMPVDFIEESV